MFLQKKERTNVMIDMMDAFFLVPCKKTRTCPSTAEVYLPLEQMMRLKLYQSLTEDPQT